MAKRKILTEAQKDAIKDKRLQKKYGITLARQNEMRQEQDNKCKICRSEFTQDNPACTDHFHYKVRAEKISKGVWTATAYSEKESLCAMGLTKVGAVNSVKSLMAPRSVRGLLCRKCNRGLGYIERFFDSARRPETLVPVMEYFQARQVNT